MAQELPVKKSFIPLSNRSKRNPYKDGPFWGICIGHAFTHWYPASMYVLLPYIVIAYQFSVTQAGLLLTLRSFVNALLSMPIGALTDMTERKNIFLAISLFMVGLPFLFIGFVDKYWIVALLFIVMGVGNEFWHPASYTALTSRFPEQKGLVFGYHSMAANLGDMLAPLVVGALIIVYSWQEIIYWNFIPGLLFALFILFALRNSHISSSSTEQNKHAIKLSEYFQGLKQLLHNKAVLIICFLSGIRAMAQSGIMVLLPLYFALEIGLNALWVGVLLAVLQVGGLIAAPIVGKMSDHSGPRKIVKSTMALTSVMIVIVAIIRIEWLMIGVIAILGFFLFAVRPVLQAWAMDRTSQEMMGTTTSLLFTIQAAMGAISPIVGAYLAQTFSFSVSFYFLAGVILLGNFIVYFVPKSEEERAVS